MTGPLSSIREQLPAEWSVAGPGVQMRPLVEAAGVALVLYRIDPGTKFKPHSHDFAELGVLVSGKGLFLYENESRDIRAGDSFSIPSGGLHGFEVPPASEPVVMLNVNVGVPGTPPLIPTSALIRLAEPLITKLPVSPPRRKRGR